MPTTRDVLMLIRKTQFFNFSFSIFFFFFVLNTKLELKSFTC